MNTQNLTTVIIATYNRCESLKDTLESLLHQVSNGSFDYEIIVADNNSTDRTKQVVGSFQKRFKGRLRYLFEPKQGKCYALNKAIKQAKGEIVAFTDDDVMVEKRWVQKILRKFQENGRLDGFIGGAQWQDGSAVYAKRDALRGNGLNMAITKKALDMVKGFDMRLGPGAEGCAAEDRDIIYRIKKSGGVIALDETISVTHKNRPDYLTNLRYFDRDMQGFAIGWMKHLLLYKDPLAPRKIYWHLTGFINGFFKKLLERDYKAAKRKYVAIAGIIKGIFKGYYIFGIKYKRQYRAER